MQSVAFVGLFGACTIPQFILEIFYAKPFDVTALSDSVNYEFASSEYAIDFAVLNRDAEWVKIDGQNLPSAMMEK